MKMNFRGWAATTLSKGWPGAARSRLLAAGVLVALAAGGLAAAVVFQPWSSADAAQFTTENLASEKVQGYLHRPMDGQAAPFTLTDQNGQRVRLADFKGRWVVMDWIYTNCTDACPALTADMKALQQRFGDKLGSQVQLVSVTIDPERDTVPAMKFYAQAVQADVPGWSWLTGSKQETDAVAEAYGVAFSPAPPEHGMAMFDHTVLTVVIDPDGREHDRFFGVRWSDDMIKRLEEKVGKSS